MNKNAERILAVARRAYTKLGAWVAGFTFWRFVLFSILVLVATNLVGRLISPERQTVTVTTTVTTKSKPEPPGNSPAPPSVPPPASPVPAPASPPGTSAKKDCVDEVNVGWTGIHIRDCNGGKVTASEDSTSVPADLEDEDIEIPTVHTKLKDWMLAMLAVLWVMWFVGRARRKAEVRADRAESVAEKESLERQVAEARLQALQAQVEPHFLFNTLGAVEHLIETDPPRAAEMQRHLIAFLRGAMPRMRGESVTLGDEIELCRNYLAIMKIRMEDRLVYSIDLPPELAKASFPPMMLQSVVENAIKHGLEPKAEGGSILISARAAAGRLRVAVADSGLGFGNNGTAGTGIGLNNIRERLAGLFGDKSALVITPNAPTGAQVVIEIPHDGTNGNSR